MSIGIKEASKIAVSAIADLFGEQSLSNVMFEEVDKDDRDNWLITVGFDRRTEKNNVMFGGVLAGAFPTERKYKVVSINGGGEVISVKDRMLESK
jgi:hypothetical protein